MFHSSFIVSTLGDENSGGHHPLVCFEDSKLEVNPLFRRNLARQKFQSSKSKLTWGAHVIFFINLKRLETSKPDT